MTIRDLLGQLAQLQREIDDHAAMIDSFQRDNRKNMDLVAHEVAGGTRGHDKQMAAAIQRAESQLTRSRTALLRASEALKRVQAIWQEKDMATIQEVITAARRIDRESDGLRVRLLAAEGQMRSSVGRLAPTVKGSRSGEAAVREVQDAQAQVKAAVNELQALHRSIDDFVRDLEK